MVAAAVVLASTQLHADVLAGGGAVAPRPSVHLVVAGDDLWTIARRHGCQVEDLLEANHLRSDRIHPGRELRIPRCDIGPLFGPPAPAAVVLAAAAEEGDEERPLLVRHRVAAGQSLYTIARRYETTVEHLIVQNGLPSSTIYAGQELDIVPGAGRSARVVPGQSRGSPQAGRLLGGVQFPPGSGYYRRRPHYAWGANHTVGHTQNVIRAVRARYPRIHTLAIGDLSAREGGRIPRHNSHQSGRDIDVGLYFRRVPSGYPETFVAATRDNLDFAATWSLLEGFAATEALPGGVEVMFLNYQVQRLLYEWARRQDIPRARIERLLQYPRGQGYRQALIRHEPGHTGHVHVRFRCPERDPHCG
jgi:LysM repeat protein